MGFSGLRLKRVDIGFFLVLLCYDIVDDKLWKTISTDLWHRDLGVVKKELKRILKNMTFWA